MTHDPDDVRSVNVAEHEEYDHQHLKFLSPSHPKVPVLIGPKPPRQDSKSDSMRLGYSRLMLILFKLCRHASDLIQETQDRTAAFNDFERVCQPQFARTMSNIQILHECCDSRNDRNVRTRANQRYRFDPLANNSGRHTHNIKDDENDGLTNTEVSALNVLYSIQNARSQHRANDTSDAQKCVEAATTIGLIDKKTLNDSTGLTEHENLTCTDNLNNVNATLIDHHDQFAEDIWRQTYADRKQDQRSH